MKKSNTQNKKKRGLLWFAYGSAAGALAGLFAVISLGMDSVIILAACAVLAIYVYLMTHQSDGNAVGKLTNHTSKALVLSTLVICSVAAVGIHLLHQSNATNQASPETNKPSYWGNNCVKYEFSGEKLTYTASSGATKVIVKGGTAFNVYTSPPFTNLTAPINPNTGKPYAISHVIVCGSGSTSPQPSPAPNPQPTPTPGPHPTPNPTPNPTPTPGTAPTPQPSQTVNAGGGASLTASVQRLPNVGPGDILIIGTFAAIGGYIFSEIYRFSSDSSSRAKPASHRTRKG